MLNLHRDKKIVRREPGRDGKISLVTTGGRMVIMMRSIGYKISEIKIYIYIYIYIYTSGRLWSTTLLASASLRTVVIMCFSLLFTLL